MNPGPSLGIIASAVTITAATLLLLLQSIYCSYHIIVANSTSLGVAELITQFLSLIGIFWLPLCRMNKLGYTYPQRLLRSPTLVGYQQ